MDPSINRDQYFQRQSTVHGLGKEGLEKLGKTRVAIVGCGGVGSAATHYLARSGIGYLRLIDQDIVDPSNLHRMHCIGKDDVYSPKAEAVSKSLMREHDWLEIDPIVGTVQRDNIDQLLSSTDLIIDGLDNFRSRYVLNNYSVRTRTPYFFASAIGNQAHALLFDPPRTGCLECVLPAIEPSTVESCETIGVTATTIGMIGAILASETVGYLVRGDSKLLGRLLTIDLACPDFLVSPLSKRQDCRVCSTPENLVGRESDQHEAFTILCGENSVSAVPPGPLNIDLAKLPERLGNTVRLLSVSDRALVFQEANLTVSVFIDGRLIIRGATKESARSAALKIWQKLGLETLTITN